MSRKILAAAMIYIVLMATLPVIPVRADPVATPPGFADSGISCEEIDDRYHNSYDGAGAIEDRSWCNTNQDWFSWTCAKDDDHAEGRLFIARCLGGCEKEDKAIVEGGCKSGASPKFMKLMLGYAGSAECPEGSVSGTPTCSSGSSSICLESADEEGHKYLTKTCAECMPSGLCKEDVMPGGKNGFKKEITVVNEELEDCLADPKKCEDDLANKDCTLQERINFLCRYGQEPGDENYNPPGSLDGGGYPHCGKTAEGKAIGFSDPKISAELIWLAQKRNELKGSGSYKPNKPLKSYPDYTGTGICQVGGTGNGATERQLSDCRIVRVITTGRQIEKVQVCNPGDKASDGTCPELKDEDYESCFKDATSLADLHLNDPKIREEFFDWLKDVIDEGDLACDIPICQDAGKVCDEDIFFTKIEVGNNEKVQVISSFSNVAYHVELSSSNPDAGEGEESPATHEGEKRDLLVFLSDDAGEQAIESSEVAFDSSGNTAYDGSFVPLVSGSYTIHFKLASSDGSCIVKQETFHSGGVPGLLVFTSEEDGTRDAMNQMIKSGKIAEPGAGDDEYTQAFKAFLKKRAECYSSDAFKGYNYPSTFCDGYLESFKTYMTLYAKSNVPADYQENVLRSMESKDTLVALSDNFEHGIRNSIINYYLEAGEASTTISKGILNEYESILIEDATGVGSGFGAVMTVIGNPLRLISMASNGLQHNTYMSGIKVSREKIDDIERSFFILRTSLYGNPLDMQETDNLYAMELRKKTQITGAVTGGDVKPPRDWTRTYNLIRYSSEEGKPQLTDEIRSILYIPAGQEITDKDIIESLDIGGDLEGREKELFIEEVLLEPFPSDDGIKKSGIDALKGSVNEYAPSVPLFKAINEENVPLILFGFGWLNYFTVMEGMGGWTDAKDAEFRGLYEATASEAYADILDRYDGMTGAGPLWHDRIYEAKKVFLLDVVGTQWGNVDDLFKESYPSEAAIARKGLDKISANINWITASQVLDWVAGAVVGVIVGNWIFSFIGKAGAIFRGAKAAGGIASKLGSARFAKTVMPIFKFAGKATKYGSILLLASAGTYFMATELFGTWGHCYDEWFGPEETGENARLAAIRRNSATMECMGRSAQTFILIFGPFTIERYGAGWMRGWRSTVFRPDKGYTGKVWDMAMMRQDIRNAPRAIASIPSRLRVVTSTLLRKRNSGISNPSATIQSQLDSLVQERELLAKSSTISEDPAYISNLESEIARLEQQLRQAVGQPNNPVRRSLIMGIKTRVRAILDYLERHQQRGQTPPAVGSRVTGAQARASNIGKLASARLAMNKLLGLSTQIDEFIHIALTSSDDAARRTAVQGLRQAVSSSKSREAAISALMRIVREGATDAADEAIDVLFALAVETGDDTARTSARRALQTLSADSSPGATAAIARLKTHFEARSSRWGPKSTNGYYMSMSGGGQGIASADGKIVASFDEGVAAGITDLKDHALKVNSNGYPDEYFEAFIRNNQDSIAATTQGDEVVLVVLDEVSTPIPGRRPTPGEGNRIFLENLDRGTQAASDAVVDAGQQPMAGVVARVKNGRVALEHSRDSVNIWVIKADGQVQTHTVKYDTNVVWNTFGDKKGKGIYTGQLNLDPGDVLFLSSDGLDDLIYSGLKDPSAALPEKAVSRAFVAKMNQQIANNPIDSVSTWLFDQVRGMDLGDNVGFMLYKYMP